MKKLLLLLFSVLIVVFFVSCKKKIPVACFSTNKGDGSLVLYDTVVFNASCSKNAEDYHWDFDDALDKKTYFGIEVTKIFLTTGNHHVKLSCTDGTKTGFTTKTITVN